jgi:hypothetical protein
MEPVLRGTTFGLRGPFSPCAGENRSETPLFRPARAGFDLARGNFRLARPFFTLRDENSLCAGLGLVLRGLFPFCATIFHFARRISGLRGLTVTLRGPFSGLREATSTLRGLF